MKLEGVGAVMIRLTAVAFVLRGLTVLASVAWNYSAFARAVEKNAALKQAFDQSLKAASWTIVVSLTCGIVAWMLSQQLGRLLACGLESEVKSV